MQIPLQITFRNLDPSPAVRQRVVDYVSKLEHFHSRIVSCRVVIRAANRRHRKGRLFNVKIDSRIPGCELVVDHEHEDIYLAIHDAFGTVERQLEDMARRRRGEVKSHAALAEAE